MPHPGIQSEERLKQYPHGWCICSFFVLGYFLHWGGRIIYALQDAEFGLPASNLKNGHLTRNMQHAPQRLHFPSLFGSTRSTRLVANLFILPSKGPSFVVSPPLSDLSISPICLLPFPGYAEMM